MRFMNGYPTLIVPIAESDRTQRLDLYGESRLYQLHECPGG